MMKKLLLLLMMLAFALPPAIAGLQTVTIHRNEGQFEESNGVYYCYKSGLMMTFTSGMNNPNYLVEHQQVYFEVRSVNPEYIIKKIVFHCVDNTTSDNLDCFYWGPSTISIVQNWTYPNQPGTYRYRGYTGTWTGTTNKIQFSTMAKPVRFGSVDITFEKETGDIFDLVTDDSQLQAGGKYAIVNQYYPTDSEDEGYAMSTLMNDSYSTIGRTKVSFVPNTNKHKVIVNDETRIITLQTGTNVDDRPWYLGSGSSTVKMRRASSQSGSAASAKGYPLSFENIGSYPEFFPVKIEIGAEADNYPAKIRFCDNSANYNKPTDTNYAIAHNNNYQYFKVLDITSANSYASTQRVHLYKPAQNYIITTACHPTNGGEITLTDGVLEINGQQTSQEHEDVSFYVSVNDGYTIQSVTATDANNNPVTIDCTQTTLQGNRYTFTMPAADVNIVVNYVQANYHVIHAECDPTYGGEYTFSSGTFDSNNEVVSYPGNNVNFGVTASQGYVFTGITATSEDGQSTVLPLTDNGDGTYSFTMPDNDVTLSATFDRVIGDIFELVTSGSQIVEGSTYIIVSQNHDVVMKHKSRSESTFQGAPIVEWPLGVDDKSKVRVDDNACFFRMDDLVLNTSNNYKSAYMNTLVGYIGYNGYDGTTGNVITTPELSGYNRATMYISGADNGLSNYLCTFDSIKTANRTIRYEVATNSFKIINYGNSSDERVWLYKLDESYYNISTLCTPDGGGTITVSATSERENQPVTFTVTPNAGYTFNPETGVTVTYTDGTTGTISVNYDENTGIYSFTMPGKAVTITANFDVLPEPYNVIPNCVPEQGGYMNINGHGNNETTSSLPGSTVNFEVHTNWGYRIADVTAVNQATGETVQLIQTSHSDAGNNYTFTMPVGEVHITAKFYQPLFLLGTAMGRTSWCPAGPEFTFDPVNDQYYLDVYFKGIGDYGSQASGDDDYGYFSLAGGIDDFSQYPEQYTWATAPSGYGNWNNATGRLAAQDPNTIVNGESTDVVLYGDRQDNAFKIKAGIYRIIVNHDMDRMSIVQNNPAISFDPVSGSTVALNTPVGITSNLYTKVDSIADLYGITEVPQKFRNKVNDGATWTSDANNGENGAQAVIPNVGQNTVTAEAWIGYIVVPGSAVYTVPNYYDIHTVVTPEGAATITVENSEMAGETVNFTVSNPNTGFENYTLYAVTVTDEDGNVTTLPISGSGNYSFTMPESDVTITADFRTLNNVTATWTPVDGGEVTIQQGDMGTYFYNGETVTFTVTTNTGYEITSVSITSGGSAVNYTDNGDGTYTFTMPEADVTVTAEFGIKGEYQVNLVNYPPQGGSMTAEGHVRIENNNVYSDEGKTVVITPTPSADWLFDGISAQDEHGNPVTLTNNGDGTYSMVMPAADVTVTANYYQILPPDPYNIYTDFDPQQGSVTLTGDAADALAFGGETVTFTVEAFYQSGYMADKYKIDEVYVTIDGTEDQVLVTKLSGGDMLSDYSFTMPEGNVTVHATFKRVYEVILNWTPMHYGADRIDVFEPGHFPGGDASNVKGLFIAGTTVEIRVKNLWENEDQGNYTIEYCGAYYNDIGNGIYGDLIEEIDQSGFDDLGNHDYRVQFVMPACDVDAYINLRAHTTLKFIESSQYIPDGALVEVSDELIGTWSAQNVLWAKDQVESFNKTEKEDGAHDYVRNELRLQKKAWNQNNGVRLRFDNVLYSLMENEGLDPDDENAVKVFTEEFYKEIEGFVDNYIKGGTIKGEFRCDGNYIDEGLEIIIDNPVDCYGHNHKAAFEIWVNEMPKHRDGYDPTQPSESLGYPGYIPDPREMPKSDGGFYDDPIKYNYNHYTTANFCATNIAGRSGLYEDGDNIVGPEAPDSLQNKKVFFMNPKDGEIAQVWGVYKGRVEDVAVVTMPKCFPDKAGTMSGDLFTIYKSAPGYNRHDFAGYFLVADNCDGWQYNRLSEDRFDYGRPSGDNQLHPGEAYLFHAAIEEIGHYEEGVRGPRRTPDAKEVPDDGLLLPFRVYPLDLYSPKDNFTAVREIRPQEASEIVSIRYYNMMGQESKTPFDGINIEVIRYKDGSKLSRKVLR